MGIGITHSNGMQEHTRGSGAKAMADQVKKWQCQLDGLLKAQESYQVDILAARISLAVARLYGVVLKESGTYDHMPMPRIVELLGACLEGEDLL